MERNYPAAGFGDLGAGTGWTYDRSAKASFVYGSSRSSHPDPELLHRQTYGPPHPLQGYAANHHPGSSRQGGAWASAGRTLGLSGLFDTGLHHPSPSGPDPSVMNLISALESRGPQPPSSASSLLSQFRTPSWQTAMHTPGPPELFIPGALPGSSSFPSSSSLSAYQHAGSFSGRSFTPSLSLQDTPTFSPNSNGLLSPHDSLLHLKSSQSSLGFDRFLSQSSTYRTSQESTASAQIQNPASSSHGHLSSAQFNLLSSQLHNQSAQLYNTSMLSSTPTLPPTTPPLTHPSSERSASRQDSVIKHYQRSTPSHPTPLPMQPYVGCGGSSYEVISSHHRPSVSCSPLGEQSPPSDLKPSPRTEPQTFNPIIQASYSSSSSSTSSSAFTKGVKCSSSSSGYSSSGPLSSSSRTPRTPPSASSTSSSSSNTNPSTLSDPSRQQPPPQPAPSTLPVLSSVQQSAPVQCLSAYGSPSVANSGTGLPERTSPQQHAQTYSPSQPPAVHMSHSYSGFSSPHAQDLSSGGADTRAKAFTGPGSVGHSFSAEMLFEHSSFSSPSLQRAASPSLGYGSAGESTGSGPVSGTTALASSVGSAGSGSVATNVSNGSGSYHLPESSPSSSISSTISRPGLNSPAAARPAQSPGGSGATKYLSSLLSPAFISSPPGPHDSRQTQSQSYHASPPKPKRETSTTGAQQPQDEEEDDDFLIHHLLHAQDTTPHSSQHLPLSQQLSQPLSQERDEDRKEESYDISKISGERYHFQSVIRTNNTANTFGPESTMMAAASDLNSQLEISHNEQHQNKAELNISKSNGRAMAGGTDALSLSHAICSNQPQHDSMGSVDHYAREEPYTQHCHHSSQVSSHAQHPQHLHIPKHAQQTQHAQHSQQGLSHSHPHSHPQMELNKTSDSKEDIYMCNTPDVQQTPQSQAPLSLVDSPPAHSHQTQLLQAVLSQTTHTKTDPQQTSQQQHPLRQQSMGSSAGTGSAGVESLSQKQSSQMQLQFQTRGMDTAYNIRVQQRDSTRASQASMSPLDIIDQTLSQANSRDSGGALERSGIGMTVRGREGGSRDIHRQQLRLTPHHIPQQPMSDLHDFLSETDLGLSTPSHLHHLNQPQTHSQPQSLLQPQTYAPHQLSHSHLAHPQAHRIATNMGSPQHRSQPQQRDPETQLSRSHIDQLKQHQFDTVGQDCKVGPNQALQQQFAPLTSVCFTDSLLHDGERPFFPEMEDMFGSADYKSGCVGDSGTGQAAQDSLTQGHCRRQEALETLKTGSVGESYDMAGHDQSYGSYCPNLAGAGNGSHHLDLDSMKTHELPSTVNTDQLGLLHSQTSTIALNSAGQGPGTMNKMMGAVGVGGNPSATGLTSPIFCSSRPKKLLKTSSFHLLKQRREPQPQTKKNYAQEYEFEDDEDKADVPADIRLNSRRLPDLLPDLVSSCRKAGGASGVRGLSPLMTDIDFCHTSSYSALGNPPQILPHEGPKKRGRKPTKPKREGPPRPRGRPRIRPLPEPPYCRGMLSTTGESRRGRGRGRGRGRKEDKHVEIHRDIKAQNLPYHPQQLQQFSQLPHLQQHMHQHQGPQEDHHQAPQLPHHQQQQQHVSCPSQQPYHPQQLNQQHQQPSDFLHQDPVRPMKMKLHGSTIPPSESLLRTDSLSGSELVQSDGSVGSAPTLGLSPGPSNSMDFSRKEMEHIKDTKTTHNHKIEEMMWKKESDDPLNPESWAALHKLSSSVDDKAFSFKPGFMDSFLDFLKTGKKQPGLSSGPDGNELEPLNPRSALIEAIRPLSPAPPPQTPPQPPGALAEGEPMGLSSCSSPCKPLDEELKDNLETLPSFSSDEEDSVSKNQDLQKSISSAISALYDTPHSLAAAMATAMAKAPPTLTPPSPQEHSLSPPLPATPTFITSMENGKEATPTYAQCCTEENQNLLQCEGEEVEGQPEREGEKEEDLEEQETEDTGQLQEDSQEPQAESVEEQKEVEEEKESDEQILDVPKEEDSQSGPALVPSCPSPSPSVSCSLSDSPSPSTPPPQCLSVPAPQPIQEVEEGPSPTSPPSSEQQLSYPPAPPVGSSPPPSTSPPALLSSPMSALPPSQSIPPPSTTPPPSSSDQDQEPEVGQPLSPSPSSFSPSSSSSPPPSPPTPEEAPASQRLTALHLAKKQADAALAGESEEEESESGGEGIYRERDEFVVRTEDIGTLKMALQTGREPPPIWRVQKALLQKFSPEIKDGQRQFCATSNYLGYFGDAKMHYQRLYVKFLENINKKDYVRVCSRKPWHRAALSLRRQSLPKQLSLHNQTPPRLERDERDKERQKEQREREQRERVEKVEREQEEEKLEKRERKETTERKETKLERDKESESREREQKEKEQKERQEREWQEREREEREQKDREREEKETLEREKKEKEKQEKERKDKERLERERKEKEKQERERKEREKQEREQKEREMEEVDRKEKERQEREKKEKEREVKEKVEKERQQRERERQERERREKERERERREQKDRNLELKEKGGMARKKDRAERWEREEVVRREGKVERPRLKEVKRAGEKIELQPRTKAEPPPKKRKTWLKEVPSSSSESDSSPASDDEGPVRGGVNSRAMREMFRSYVEMLVSTALDPDMIQALEDTDDELYLPPMRKIDSLLSEQKKRLLGRVAMSTQHQEALNIFPKMTADPLETGAVRVHLGGDGYNRKTLNRVKRSIPKQQDLKLPIETCRIYSLYHSLHHYKYHTFLHCKKETDSIEQAAEDPGQEEVVQQCMANQSWLESLFNSYVELLKLSAKA